MGSFHSLAGTNRWVRLPPEEFLKENTTRLKTQTSMDFPVRDANLIFNYLLFSLSLSEEFLRSTSLPLRPRPPASFENPWHVNHTSVFHETSAITPRHDAEGDSAREGPLESDLHTEAVQGNAWQWTWQGSSVHDLGSGTQVLPSSKVLRQRNDSWEHRNLWFAKSISFC